MKSNPRALSMTQRQGFGPCQCGMSPSPKEPTMYFRIIVKAAGEFAFRTSKIEDSKQLLALLGRARIGFPAADGFTISVLRAAPSTGELLSDEQVTALEQPVNDPDELDNGFGGTD